MERHHKDNYLTLMNYVAVGALNLTNTQGIPWCRICQTRGHRSKECLYLHNIISTLTSLYCKFCKSIGHDLKDCREFQPMQEKTLDTYLMRNGEQIQAE